MPATRSRGLLIATIGLGAALMYYFDPQVGRRRRALLRDRWTHTSRIWQQSKRVALRDARHRAAGLKARLENRRQRNHEVVDDAVLRGRVRAALGRAVSHPHAIEVFVSGGRVTLKGPILASEVPQLVACMKDVRGVRSVEDKLAIYAEPGNVPALQGGNGNTGRKIEWLQRNWSPTARVMAGTFGGLLAAFGLLRGGARGLALGAVGSGLLARAATNREVKSLVGLGESWAIDITKTLHIAAPVERVFDYWRNFENFPRWMSHVRDVRGIGGRTYEWIVDGPAGMPVRWRSELTNVVENREMAWRSETGALVQHSGSVQFAPSDGGTRVQVRFCYMPIGGAVGHVVAKAFGADPRSEMNSDLMRLKTLIETGNAAHDTAVSNR